MRYVGAVSWLIATVVLFLVAVPAAGQFGDNVLVQGSPYCAVDSVDFDDSDRLYVGHLIMDPETGSLIDELSWDTCTRETPESSLCVGVDDLTIGPDGSLYWSGSMYTYDNDGDEFLGDGVGRRTPDGVTMLQENRLLRANWLVGARLPDDAVQHSMRREEGGSERAP